MKPILLTKQKIFSFFLVRCIDFGCSIGGPDRIKKAALSIREQAVIPTMGNFFGPVHFEVVSQQP